MLVTPPPLPRGNPGFATGCDSPCMKVPNASAKELIMDELVQVRYPVLKKSFME